MIYSSTIPVNGFDENLSCSSFQYFDSATDGNDGCDLGLLPATSSIYNPLALLASDSNCPIFLNSYAYSCSSSNSVDVGDNIIWENIIQIGNKVMEVGEGNIIYPRYVSFLFLISTAVTVSGLVVAVISYVYGYKNTEMCSLGVISISMLGTWGSALKAAAIKEKVAVS